jgi:hypothetical protein
MNTTVHKVKTQAELDAALADGAKKIEIHGEWETVKIPRGKEIDYIYVYGTAKVGSIDVSGTAKVGSIYVSGTVTGSIDVSGTVTGSIDVSGTVTGSIDVSGTGRKFFGTTLDKIQKEHAKVLALASSEEIDGLRGALVEGRINGHLYEGKCKCLVGTLESCRTQKVIQRDSDRLAEKWYMAISPGNTPETNMFSRIAVEWIDAFIAK